MEKIKETVVESGLHSSCHGFPNIIRTNRLLIRIIWFLSMITSIVFCSFFVSRTINQFLEFDVVTKIQQINQKYLELPMITLCQQDQNKLRTKYAKEFLKQYLNKTDEEIQYIKQSDIDNSFIYILNNFPNEIKYKMGFSLKDVIFECRSNDIIYCDLDNDIKLIFHPFYGLCYQFNSGFNQFGHPVPIIKIGSAGYKNGLILTVLNRNEISYAYKIPFESNFN